MAFDAVFLTAVTEELRTALLGTRIDRVWQPDRFTVILQLRSRDFSGKLLLSAAPGSARIQLTETSPENPLQPTMFCMLLRKHLTGSRIAGIRQPPMERIAELELDGTDEFGDPCRRRLIAELMGRGANLILCGSDGRIVDCLRRIELSPEQKRPALPGLYYHYPPLPERIDPFETDPASLRKLLSGASVPLAPWLQATFGGLSPLICREIAFRVAGDVDAVASASQAEGICSFFAACERGAFSPVLLREGGVPQTFSYTEILQYGTHYTSERCRSFSALLDEFYAARDAQERMRGKTQTLRRTVTTLQGRVLRRLDGQRTELAGAADRDRLRRIGDLLKANLHVIARGQTSVRVTDFYDPELREVTIKLSPMLSPQQNAEKYYKEYNKAKNAEKILTEQIRLGEREADYLSAVLEELDRAESERDVEEIRRELTDGGYVRETGRRTAKLPPSRPAVFLSSTGRTILVGRNNRQNDTLTLKTAAKNDLWFHVQKQHGSHVVVDCTAGEPDDATVTEAAMLAAWFSQARRGQNVAVDAALVRHVKKPAGAKPGMVIYDHYRTVFVTPEEKTVEKLRTKPNREA